MLSWCVSIQGYISPGRVYSGTLTGLGVDSFHHHASAFALYWSPNMLIYVHPDINTMPTNANTLPTPKPIPIPISDDPCPCACARKSLYYLTHQFPSLFYPHPSAQKILRLSAYPWRMFSDYLQRTTSSSVYPPARELRRAFVLSIAFTRLSPFVCVKNHFTIIRSALFLKVQTRGA